MAWRLIVTLLLLSNASAFVPPGISSGYAQVSVIGRTTETLAFMAKASGGKKKRRRRKQPPSTQADVSDQVISPAPSMDLNNVPVADGSSQPPASIEELRAIANFSNGNSVPTSPSIPEPTLTDAVAGADDQLVELPDIRDTLKRKQMKKIEEETAQERKRPKISRKDRAAFLQVS